MLVIEVYVNRVFALYRNVNFVVKLNWNFLHSQSSTERLAMEIDSSFLSKGVGNVTLINTVNQLLWSQLMAPDG